MSALDNIREQIALQTAPLVARLDPLRDRWERASQRERRQATIFGVVVLAIIVALGVRGAMKTLDLLRNGVERETSRLERVEEMVREHNTLNRQVDRLKRNTISTPVSTYIEQTASKVDIVGSIDRIQNQRSEEGDFFQETVVEVRIRKISLSKLTKFMHALEHSGKAAKVQSVVAKPTFQDPRYLDVSMEVIGYRPLNAGGS